VIVLEARFLMTALQGVTQASVKVKQYSKFSARK
jgi:hypothetical protein